MERGAKQFNRSVEVQNVLLLETVARDDRGLVGFDPQMKLQMKRETLIKLDRYANEENLDQIFELDTSYGHGEGELMGFDAVLTQLHNK